MVESFTALQFPTAERTAEDMRLLIEAGLPGNWTLRDQRLLKRHIDATGKRLCDLTIGEVLRLAMVVREKANVNPDAREEVDSVG